MVLSVITGHSAGNCKRSGKIGSRVAFRSYRSCRSPKVTALLRDASRDKRDRFPTCCWVSVMSRDYIFRVGFGHQGAVVIGSLVRLLLQLITKIRTRDQLLLLLPTGARVFSIRFAWLLGSAMAQCFLWCWHSLATCSERSTSALITACLT